MSEDILRYDLLIEAALRNVVRQSLERVAQDGLPGDHHFYITFRTSHPAVEVPVALREQYPEEMTIVLQYQFYNLKVTDEGFSVVLSFNNVREKLVIPYEAIVTFADPSVNFALQFQSMAADADHDHDEDGGTDDKGTDEGESKSSDDAPRGEIISLDKFRKK